MDMRFARPLLVMTFLLLVFPMGSRASGGDIYVLEKSIDVLPQAGNFRRDETIAASSNGKMTVLKRVPNQDPRWWPQGVAIQVLSVNGREQRPIRTVYVAKKWFERGTRKGDVAQLPDPQDVQDQISVALKPIMPSCEVQVSEPVLPDVIDVPNRPADKDTYSTLAALVQTTTSVRTCQNALRKWYKENSMWKDLSRQERAKVIVSKAHDISRQMRVDGLVDTCARASGQTSQAQRTQMKAFMTSQLSVAEQDRINVTNYESNCRRYIEQNGGGNISTSLFRERASDPQSIHPEFDASLAVCIIKRETSVTDFDPHSLNYSFCESKGRHGHPRSTAHGLGQFTQTTFLSLRDSGLMPLASVEDTSNRSSNRKFFKEMSTDPDMQIESIFRYINYLMKAPSSARIRHMHDQVYSDRFEDWEKAVISYDQDRASAYIRGVHSCRTCFAKAAGDRDAEARCLSGN